MTSGLAPRVDVATGETRLCGSCARLIRFWPLEFVWRHVALDADHWPELRGSTERDPAIVTESELRLLDGNR